MAFFERQNERDCTIHSLNNAMGKVVVTKKQVLDYIKLVTDRYAAAGHSVEDTKKVRDKMAKDDTFFTADVVWSTAKNLGTIGEVSPVPGFAGDFANVDTLPSWVRNGHLVFLGLDPKGHPHAVGARDGLIYDSQRWSNGPVPLNNQELSKVMGRVFALFVVGEPSDKNKMYVVRSQPLIVATPKSMVTMQKVRQGGYDKRGRKHPYLQ